MATDPFLVCPLVNNIPEGLTNRLTIANRLQRYFEQSYRKQSNSEMPGTLKSFLWTGLIASCCCLHNKSLRNCLFRRAGFICFMWVRGLRSRALVPEALISGIMEFLTAEGAVLALHSGMQAFYDDVFAEIEDILSNQVDSMTRAWEVFRRLSEKFAEHWVCSYAYDKQNSPGKLCHA